MQQMQGARRIGRKRGWGCQPHRAQGPYKELAEEKRSPTSSCKGRSSAASEQPELSSASPRKREKISPTRRQLCISRNSVLKHCTPLSRQEEPTVLAAAAVRWNKCNCSQCSHLGRCARALGAHTWTAVSGEPGGKRPGGYAVWILMLDASPGISRETQAKHKSRLFSFQPKLRACRGCQGTCTWVFTLTVLRLRKKSSLRCSWQEQND